MGIRLEKRLVAVQGPANLRVNDQIRELREECRRNGCLRPCRQVDSAVGRVTASLLRGSPPWWSGTAGR